MVRQPHSVCLGEVALAFLHAWLDGVRARLPAGWAHCKTEVKVLSASKGRGHFLSINKSCLCACVSKLSLIHI